MSKTISTPKQKFIKECLSYNADTGKAYWLHRPANHFKTLSACKSWNKKHVGNEIITKTKKGYIRTALSGSNYFLHRLIFKLVYGYDAIQVDHKNGFASDNKISNLRDVTIAENQMNLKVRKDCKSRVLGVAQRGKSWVSRITTKGKRTYLGSFNNIFDAVCARRSAEMRFGFYVNHGAR